MPKLITLQDILCTFKQVHGDKYDYSNVDYSGMHVKVSILCKEHGEFQQTPNNHKKGKGCPKCAGKDSQCLDGFILKSNMVHSSKYSYTKVQYVNSQIRVIITCPEHGDFLQLPKHHVRGVGCPVCSKNKPISTEEFLARSKIIHNDKYAYADIVVNGSKSKVNIVCDEHGQFTQTVGHHLIGKGCPKCAKKGYQPLNDATFYIYKSETFVGFGITNLKSSRHTQHRTTFKKRNVIAELLKEYNSDGVTIQNLERAVKHHFAASIINTGVEGFKTEAVLPEKLDELIKFSEDYLNKE